MFGGTLFNRSRLARIAAVIAIAGFSLSTSSLAFAAATPVAEWNFEGSVSGSPVDDLVGTNDAIPNGAPAPGISSDVPYTTPDNAYSSSFDGSNFFVVINPFTGSDMSICASIKTLSVGSQVSPNNGHWTSAPIVDGEVGGGADDFALGIDNTGHLNYGNGPSELSHASVAVVSDNTWHHVCMTRNNLTGDVKLYVDGVFDSMGNTGAVTPSQNPTLKIGSGYDGNAPFVGNIDDLKFFTTSLTAEEVEDISLLNYDPEIQESNVVLANTGSGLNQSVFFTGLMLLILGSAAFWTSKRSK